MKILSPHAEQVIIPVMKPKKLPVLKENCEILRMPLKYKKSNRYPGKITEAIYTATSESHHRGGRTATENTGFLLAGTENIRCFTLWIPCMEATCPIGF